MKRRWYIVIIVLLLVVLSSGSYLYDKNAFLLRVNAFVYRNVEEGSLVEERYDYDNGTDAGKFYNPKNERYKLQGIIKAVNPKDNWLVISDSSETFSKIKYSDETVLHYAYYNDVGKLISRELKEDKYMELIKVNEWVTIMCNDVLCDKAVLISLTHARNE